MNLRIVIVFVLWGAFQVSAQDNHYWSQMGGISAGLLGGSAIAGLKDNSSLYYNAASMSFVDNPSISIGANTYRLRLVNIHNAYGDNENEFSSQFVVNPDLIGGLLFSKKNDQLRFGYAISTRFLYQNRISYQRKSVLPSGQTYIGDFDVNDKLQETWINSANSFKINSHFSLGYTLIIAFRSQSYSNTVSAKLIPAVDTEAISRFDSRVNYNYWNVKGLFKLSAALDYDRFRFGWNLTLPSLNLFGNGEIKRELSLVNNPFGLNNFPSNALISSSAEDVPTKSKYPLSSGLGISFQLGNKDWIHFSTELFLPIKKYSVISSTNQPVYFPESAFDSVYQKYFPEDSFLDLVSEAKFVMNFSVGYENFLTERFGLLAGFRTDFNYSNSEQYSFSELVPYHTTWDIYYFSFGVWGIYKKQKITTGLEIGASPKTQMRQISNFDNVESPDFPLMGTPLKNATANQLIFRLFLGIEINFTKEKTLN